MTLLRNKLAARIALLAVLIASLVGGFAVVTAAHGNTSAVAVNTHDGSSVFRLAFSVRQVMGDTVDSQNAAVAFASCDACRTVAISIEVLLVGGDPSTVTPTNLAVAVNQNCNLCDTFAAAYQFVVGVGTQLRLTGDGRQQIADIRRQLEGLRNQNLSDAELQAQLDTLTGQLANVLSTELVPVQGEDHGGGPEHQPPPDQSDNPTTTPTTTDEQPPPPTTASTTPTTPTDTSTTTTPQDAPSDQTTTPTTTTPASP